MSFHSQNSTSLSSQLTMTHHILIIDSQVDDYQQLVAGAKPEFDVFVLNAHHDGIEQITEILNTSRLSPHTSLSLHIVSHGSPATLYLGNSQLSLETLERYTRQIKTWFTPHASRLTPHSLYLYGCNVAAGDAGEEFLSKLYSLVKVKLAASTTPIGNKAFGGNWYFDVTTHNQLTEIAFNAETTASYSHTFATLPNISTLFNFNGSATQTSSNEARLTQASGNQNGSAFSSARIDFNFSWDFTFELYFGDSDAGADGIGFVLHNDPDGASAIGNTGEGLGIAGVRNSVGIEFDTYYNPGTSDLVADHTSFLDPETGTSITAPTGFASNIEDSNYHVVVVNWDAGTQTLSYSFDGTPTGSITRNVVANDFGGSNLIYWGFGAATGGSINEHRVRMLDFNGRLVDASGNEIINNARPTITSASAVNVQENSVGTVIDVDATDADGDAITYSITGGADSGQFSIDGSTGELSFVSEPNLEAPRDSDGNNIYEIEVTANDGNGGTNAQTINVTVTDVNEAPVIGGGSVGYWTGGQFGTTANDGKTDWKTAGNSLNILLNWVAGVTSASGNVLLVSDTQGLVGVEGFISAEGYNVTSVTGEFGAGSPNLTNLSFLQGFDFVIWDESGDGFGSIQNAAVYSTLEAYIQSGGDLLVTGYDTLASPTDTALAGLVRSTTTVDIGGDTLTTQNIDHFALNGPYGDLRNVVVDPTYGDWDGATADTSAGAISLATFSSYDAIIYTGLSSSASAALTEDDTVSTLNLLAGVIDPDGDTLNVTNLTLTGGNASGVTVNGNSLEIDPSVYNSLAEGEPEVITYSYDISDGNGGTVSQTATITINGVNDAPEITSSDTATIDENSTNVVTTVLATDVDGDSITYSITGGADAALFSVDETTGELNFIAAPDAENPLDDGGDNVYQIEVSVNDGNEGTDVQTLTVTVGSVNDNLPVFTSSATPTLAENSTSVTTVVATDADGDPITYSISGGVDAALFEIDETTGELSFITAPNFEMPTDNNGVNSDNVYEVTVSASDGSEATTQNLSISVVDLSNGVTDFNNDNLPDVVWRRPSTGQTNIWFTDGKIKIGGGPAGATIENPNWLTVGVGDFDKDGKRDDILWRNVSSGANVIWFMDGINRVGNATLDSIGTNWEVQGVGDFEHQDYTDDILWRNQSTGQTVVWTMNGASKTGTINFGTLGTAWKAQGVGDFEANNFVDDIVWRNYATGQTLVWTTDGQEKTGSFALDTVGVNWKIDGVGDLDGDGTVDDLLWYNTSNNSVSTWFIDNGAKYATSTVGAPSDGWDAVL